MVLNWNDLRDKLCYVVRLISPIILAAVLVFAMAYQFTNADWIFWQGTTNKLLSATFAVGMAYYTLVGLDRINGETSESYLSSMRESVGVGVYRGLRFLAVCYLFANILG